MTVTFSQPVLRPATILSEHEKKKAADIALVPSTTTPPIADQPTTPSTPRFGPNSDFGLLVKNTDDKLTRVIYPDNTPRTETHIPKVGANPLNASYSISDLSKEVKLGTKMPNSQRKGSLPHTASHKTTSNQASKQKSIRGLLLKKHVSTDHIYKLSSARAAAAAQTSNGLSTIASPTEDSDAKDQSLHDPIDFEDSKYAFIKSTPSFKSDSFWWNAMGFAAASIFSMAYYVAPIYFITLVVGFPFLYTSTMYWSLFAIFVLLTVFPAVCSPRILSLPIFKAMHSYFDYEVIQESRPHDRENLDYDRPYIFAHHPHAVLSYGGLCYGILLAPDYIPETAVADVVLRIPIIKHTIGLFGLVAAGKKNLIRHLKTSPVTIYVGGIAELFLSSTREEKLYLKDRRGFIKMALEIGADVIPSYHFGNTMTLSVVKNEFLARASRLLGATITLAAGRWNLPLPHQTKLLTVTGRPLRLPKDCTKPTEDDISHWHEVYICEIKRLFDTYKHRLEDYKDKELTIL